MNQQLPYDDLAALKHCFTLTLSVVNTDRQIGEQVLNQMMDQDCQRFAFTLIDKIIIPDDATDDPVIRLISVIILKNCLRNKKKQWKLTSETANIIKQKMLALMLNNTNTRLENHFQHILESLYKKVSNAQDIQDDLTSIKNLTNTTDPTVQKTLFLTLQSLFNTPRPVKNQLASEFEELAIWLIDTGNQQTQALIKEIKDFRLEVTPPNQRRNLPSFEKKLQAIESWLETVTQVVSSEFPLGKITPELVDLLQSKSYYQKLSVILQDILNLNVSLENSDSTNPIISAPIDTSAHYEINSVKAKSLDLLTIILKIFEKMTSQINVTKFDFFQAVQNHVLQLVLTSLDSFLNGEVYRELCENEESGEVDEIILHMGVFLRQTVAFKQLYSTIDFSLPDLLMRCILPLLRTPTGELERWTGSSADYVNCLFDICFEQKLGDYKRSAFTGFLNAMISSNGGKMTVLKLLLDLAEFSITPDFENYPKLAQYEELNFVAEVQPESRLETCLLTLASLHNNLDNNMKKMIQEFIQKHYSSLIDSSSMEVKINLCFFIACYSDIILNSSENQDLGADCFRFILESVNIKDEESACLIQAAAKTLEILFKKNSLSGFLIPYAMDSLKVLTEIFLENAEENIMNVILEILANYELQILEEPDFLVEFLKTLVTKIEEGLQKEKCTGDEGVKLEIMRELLQKIFKKKQYILMIQKDLEEVTQPLFTLLQELHINNKQDTIKDRHLLSLLIPLLPAVKNLTQILLSNISQAAPLVVEITHSLNYLFLKLNEIIKDPEAIAEFNKNPQTVQLLIEIIIKALHQKNGFDRSELICQGALLFQLIFQSVDSLGESQIESIFETTFQLLKSSVNPQIRVQLLCVILNALHSKFEISQSVLLKLDALNYFTNSLLENLLHFDDFSYCRQVLIIGLSSILNHSNLSQEIQSRLPELVNALLSFVQTQQLIMSKTKDDPEKFDYKSDKILLKKFLENQDVIEEEQVIQTNQDLEQEDEDREEEEENNNYYRENRPIDMLVDVDFKTEFKNKNTLEFFKNEISKNTELLQNVLEKKKEFIENLLKK